MLFLISLSTLLSSFFKNEIENYFLKKNFVWFLHISVLPLMFKNDLNNHILIGITICMYMIHGHLFQLPRRKKNWRSTFWPFPWIHGNRTNRENAKCLNKAYICFTFWAIMAFNKRIFYVAYACLGFILRNFCRDLIFALWVRVSE